MGSLKLEKKDAIAWITIDNQARRNAMSLAMWRELHRLVEQLDADPQIRVLVLKGAGEQAFVSGADISEFSQRADSEAETRAFGEAVEAAENALCQCSKPVIAMMQGICMGGGIGIAVSCDLRYCSADTRFRMPAARLGLGYALDSMRRIVNVLGNARTAELFYTARVFDGVEAARIGMVHQVVDAGELASTVQQVAESMAANAPMSLKAAKLAIGALANHDEAAYSQVHQAVAACYDSEDYTEGRTAFMEKRQAQFKGR
jgi:enoyl-CoA hydratase/carnithine racemase